MAKARWETEHTVPVMRALEKEITDVGKAIKKITTVTAGEGIVGEIIGSMKPMLDLQREIPKLDLSLVSFTMRGKMALVSFAATTKKSFQEMAQSWSVTMDSIQEKWDILHQGMNAVFQQAQTNRLIGIENEYKARLNWINANVKDEGERQKAITALEAEYEIKKTEAKRAAAKSAKAFAIAEAVMNTAQGVTKALAQGGFLLGIIWAAIVAAMGAAQIAMIARQPIPLAKGAIFKKPTRLYSQEGATYDVGEGGEPEVLAPLSKLPAMARATGVGGNVYIELHNYIGDEKIEQRVYKIVNRGGQLGKIRIPAKAVGR
jgi:hypothetical protein